MGLAAIGTHGRFAAVSDQFGNTIDRTGRDDIPLVKHDRMRPLLDTTGTRGQESIHYYHATVLPLMVHPDVSHVLACFPEMITLRTGVTSRIVSAMPASAGWTSGLICSRQTPSPTWEMTCSAISRSVSRSSPTTSTSSLCASRTHTLSCIAGSQR